MSSREQYYALFNRVNKHAPGAEQTTEDIVNDLLQLNLKVQSAMSDALNNLEKNNQSFRVDPNNPNSDIKFSALWDYFTKAQPSEQTTVVEHLSTTAHAIALKIKALVTALRANDKQTVAALWVQTHDMVNDFLTVDVPAAQKFLVDNSWDRSVIANVTDSLNDTAEKLGKLLVEPIEKFAGGIGKGVTEGASKSAGLGVLVIGGVAAVVAIASAKRKGASAKRKGGK